MKHKIIFLFIFALCFAACSKEDATDNGGLIDPDPDSFVAVDGSTVLTFEGSSLAVAEELAKEPKNIISQDAWICFKYISKETLLRSGILNYIRYNGERINDGVNVALLNYYGGTYIRPVASADYAPILLNYNSANKAKASLYKIYTNGEIPVGDNKMTEFYLKRGNMIVLADNADGTGAHKVYFAIDHDCAITLDANLASKVSFMRVTPWSYVSKRGIGGNTKGTLVKTMGVQWYYNWGQGDQSTSKVDYAPMIFGRWGEMTSNMNDVINKPYTNHLLGFNEPDAPEQSNLTYLEAADRAEYMPMGGVRVGSPACREGEWNKWLPPFMVECKKRGITIDFICTHWYDWGNWGSTNNTNPDIDQVVARFKADIDACYRKYGLPIWITEFNANTNRPSNIHTAFLEKAIPMLEAHPAVERYAYFQPMSGNGHYLVTGSQQLTQTGIAYRQVLSTPAVKESNPKPTTLLSF